MTALKWLLLVLGLVAACEGGDDPSGAAGGGVATTPGPLMRPGQNCLRCHWPGGQAEQRRWTAAGTVFPSFDANAEDGVSGVKVVFSDEQGARLLELTTNAAGNFYTDRALPERYLVHLEYQGMRVDMPCAPPAGSCNACHSPDPVGFAPGRIFVPGVSLGEEPFDCADWENGGSGRAP